LTGNLTADPEAFFTEQGIAGARISVACNDRVKDDKGEWTNGQVVYLKATLWRSTAELAINNTSKGQKVVLTGKLTIDKYTDKAGIERQTPSVIVDQFAIVPHTSQPVSQSTDPWGETAPF